MWGLGLGFRAMRGIARGASSAANSGGGDAPAATGHPVAMLVFYVPLGLAILALMEHWVSLPALMLIVSGAGITYGLVVAIAKGIVAENRKANRREKEQLTREMAHIIAYVNREK